MFTIYLEHWSPILWGRDWRLWALRHLMEVPKPAQARWPLSLCHPGPRPARNSWHGEGRNDKGTESSVRQLVESVLGWAQWNQLHVEKAELFGSSNHSNTLRSFALRPFTSPFFHASCAVSKARFQKAGKCRPKKWRSGSSPGRLFLPLVQFPRCEGPLYLSHHVRDRRCPHTSKEQGVNRPDSVNPVFHLERQREGESLARTLKAEMDKGVWRWKRTVPTRQLVTPCLASQPWNPGPGLSEEASGRAEPSSCLAHTRLLQTRSPCWARACEGGREPLSGGRCSWEGPSPAARPPPGVAPNWPQNTGSSAHPVNWVKSAQPPASLPDARVTVTPVDLLPFSQQPGSRDWCHVFCPPSGAHQWAEFWSVCQHAHRHVQQSGAGLFPRMQGSAGEHQAGGEGHPRVGAQRHGLQTLHRQPRVWIWRAPGR